MRFLVTGGAGFIGSHLVKRLVKEGGEVIVLDNLITGKIENLEEVLDKIHFIEGDIRDYNLLLTVTKNIDYVFHEAALTSVVKSVEDPKECNEINIEGTLNVLMASFKNQVKKVIFASSSAVYGDTPFLPKKEDMIPNPLSPYAISKYTGELYLRFFYKIYHLEGIALRYFNVYGPNQDPKSPYSAVIPKFITALLRDEPPTIFGDGNQTRDFVYVEDVVEANIKALERGNSERIYNIAGGRKISVKELFLIIKKLIGKEIDPTYAPPREGEIRNSFADITLAKRELFWKPQFSLEEGLKNTIEWYSKFYLQA